MKKQPRFLFGLVTTLLLACADVQGQVINYLDGTPIRIKKPVPEEGGQWLVPAWRLGSITAADGRVFNNLLLLYDAQNDELFFQNGQSDEVLVPVNPVREFSFTDPEMAKVRTFRRGYPAPAGGAPVSYLEVLADGRLQWLKRTRKVVSEVSEYNSSTSKRVVTDEVTYYFFVNGALVPVKRSADAVKTALSGFTPQLEKEVTGQKLNLKKEEDITRLVNLLNAQ